MSKRAPTRHPEDYLLTFHTYGTWLPGDARGWHRRGDGETPRPPAPKLEAWCRRRMVAPALFFTRHQRAIVAASFCTTCAHRGYRVHTVTVQPAHVHVVVTAAAAADDLVAYLKRWATRALRDDGLPADQPVWADHGSTRYLYAPERRVGAARYVDDHHRPRRP